MQKQKKYYENTINYPYNIYNIFSPKTNSENIDKYKNEFINNQEALDINMSQEEINSKEETIQLNDEDEIEEINTGKFRIFNGQVENENKNNIRNEYYNDKMNYSTFESQI